MYAKNGGFSEVKWEDFFIRMDKERDMLDRFKAEVEKERIILYKEDYLRWMHGNKGEFSVKKLSNLLLEDGELDTDFDFDKIWKLKAPPRVKSFLWMIAIGRIPTKDFLFKRGVVTA